MQQGWEIKINTVKQTAFVSEELEQCKNGIVSFVVTICDSIKLCFDCLIQEILSDHWVTEVCPADNKLKGKQKT